MEHGIYAASAVSVQGGKQALPILLAFNGEEA